MGISDDLTCLLRNLYAGQEATVRTGHETTDWFQIVKGLRQGCILSPCLYAEYIMRNVGLDEAQEGIKIAPRNINNLRYGRTIQKDLHNPDNHDSVITDLEPDILECEVKWALESITTEEEPRWRRSRTGRTLSPPQIHQKSI